MSIVIIENPYDGFDVNFCGACLEIQMASFRNQIKEQWNRLINDGKTDKVRIPFEINPKLPWEQAISMVNGSPICLTHAFITVNKGIEAKLAFEEAAKKPQLDTSHGSIDGFLKQR